MDTQTPTVEIPEPIRTNSTERATVEPSPSTSLVTLETQPVSDPPADLSPSPLSTEDEVGSLAHQLTSALSDIDFLAKIIGDRENAINIIIARIRIQDAECDGLFKQIESHVFEKNNVQSKMSGVGTINATEYAGQVHHFFVNSQGSDERIHSDSMIRTAYRQAAQLTHPDKGGDPNLFAMAKALYKARDFEGLMLLIHQARLSNPNTRMSDAELAQTLTQAKSRMNALRRKMHSQECSIGFQTLAEHVRKGQPIAFLRNALTQWLNKLVNPTPL